MRAVGALGTMRQSESVGGDDLQSSRWAARMPPPRSSRRAATGSESGRSGSKRSSLVSAAHRLRYSLFICLADAGSSHTAYFISVLITFLIVLSCITFSLETLPVFRVASEVNKEPYIVFELIERIAIAVFTVEYVLRLLTYSAVPREEDADSKLLLFEARMLERRAEAASRRDGTYSDGKYDGSSDDDDMDGAFASQAGSDGRGVPEVTAGLPMTTTRAAQRVSVASDSDSRQAVPGSAPGRTGGAKTGPRAHFSSWTGPSKTGAGVGGSGGAVEGGSPQRKASGKDGLSKTTSGNDLHRANLGLGRSKRRLVQVIGDPSLDPVASGRTARYIKPSKSVRMLSGVMQPGQITEFQRLRLHSNADGAAVTPDGARHRAASSSSRDESGTAHLRSGSRDEGGLGLSIEPRSAVYGGAKAPFSGAAAPQHTAAGAASGLASPGAGASGQEATGGIIARRRASAKVAPAEQISGSSELVQPGGDGGSGSPRMHHLVAFGSSQQPRPRDRGLCQPCRRFCSSVGLLPPGENEGVFESSWSLDEQATKEEARQLADLRSKAASNTCCRRAASELHRVWQFVLAPLNIVDLLAIVPFYIELFAAGSGGVGLTVFRILRLGRVFRIFKLGKSSATLQLMAKVMVASVDALSIIIFFIAIGVILFGALIWIAEGGEYDEAEGAFLRLNEFGTGRERTPFDSIPATAWFVIVTLTTLGYGDQVPTSTLGRFIAGLLALVGILVLALPVTILGANFAYYYSQDEKEKQEAERERFRAQEGFEDDLSDVYSQAGALDELALPGPDRFDADDHDHDDDDDEAEKDPAAFARSMSMHDDVPRWEQRKAAFVPVQAGGYSPALRCFVYNPFVKDDVFADGIAEALAAEVDDRVADLRRDAAQREAIAARRWQRRVEREARREGELEAPASLGSPGSRPGPAGAGRRRAASNERDRAGSGWDARGAQQHGGPEAALALRDRSPSWAEAGELAEALSSRVVRRRSAAAQARKHRRLSSARPGVPVTGAKTMAGLGQKGGPAAQATGEAGAHGGPLAGGNRRLSAGAVMTHRPSSSGEGGNESLRLGTQDAAELSYGRDRPRGAGPPPDESHDSGTTRDIFAKLTEARQHREAGPRSRTFAKGLGELAPDGPADWHSGRVHGPAGAAAAMRAAGGGAGLGSGGQSTASVGGNMGVSWQLRQVVKQVTRAIRADGTAEAITSVRLEQAELRAALDDTRAGLATALAELRSVTDVLRDQRAVAASSVGRRRSSASVGDTAMQLRQRLTADELRQLVSELSHQAPRE
ncbi:hypothetical protein FNF31_00429 [Cafeteria roenbergensis]|uniref:Ion transport domain-containing protein n=1 Tax=Cafeteria roenbergensis TaxID=33653 RepID=A0A5A8DTP4_CAFRO|nr:hypothetical protein FNF31_00429 [Cafeteria roenbergensis]